MDGLFWPGSAQRHICGHDLLEMYLQLTMVYSNHPVLLEPNAAGSAAGGLVTNARNSVGSPSIAWISVPNKFRLSLEYQMV